MIFQDIDGCLAEFCEPFSRLIREEDPTMPIIDSAHQPDWSTWGGLMTDKRANIGWEKVKATENWWETLPSLAPPSVFRRIAAAHHDIPILFVTSRIPTLGRSVYHQCINWLEAHGIMEPLVVVAHGSKPDRTAMTSKQEIAQTFRPYFAIEDCPQVALDYAAVGVEVALLDWPYTEGTRAPGIHRMGIIEALAMAGVPEL